MKYEDFENELFKKNYGIVAMNHYSIGKEKHLYCVVLGENGKAIKEEGTNSEEVFRNISNKIKSLEGKVSQPNNY